MSEFGKLPLLLGLFTKVALLLFDFFSDDYFLVSLVASDNCDPHIKRTRQLCIILLFARVFAVHNNKFSAKFFVLD